MDESCTQDDQDLITELLMGRKVEITWITE